jgi:hypothetical protein
MRTRASAIGAIALFFFRLVWNSSTHLNVRHVKPPIPRRGWDERIHSIRLTPRLAFWNKWSDSSLLYLNHVKFSTSQCLRMTGGERNSSREINETQSISLRVVSSNNYGYTYTWDETYPQLLRQRRLNTSREVLERERRCLAQKLPGALSGVKPRTDFDILIDKEERRIFVLDERGVDMSPNTGLPRRLPHLRIIEMNVPGNVRPGQNFTYLIAGYGHIRCTCPEVVPGSVAETTLGFGVDRSPTMLIAVPEREMGAVPHYYRGPETLSPWYKGAHTIAQKFPPEICYFDPRVRHIRDGDFVNGTDGEWEVPSVNATAYRQAYSAALACNPNIAWDFFLELNGSVSFEKSRDKNAKWRGNAWGTRKAEDMFRLLDINGPCMKPDVHFPADETFRKYTQLVDGDCRNCSTVPPSPLAMTWLPKIMHKQYKFFLNISAAAAEGDAVANATLAYINTTKLMEKMSIYQQARFNGGRLRLRYAFRDTNVTCKQCGSSWSRTPFELSPELNETLVQTTFEWARRRQLFVAAQEGMADQITLLGETLGCNVDDIDEENDNCTALHVAAEGDHVEAVQALLKMNATIDVPDARNWTALHWYVSVRKITIL